MPPFVIVEVFVLDPSSRFVIVSFPGPLPQHLKDGTVYILKDFFAHHMLMIPCPSSNERVEQQDQVTSSGSLMVLDHFSDFFQKRFHVLFRRLDDELAVVLAYMLSEKVEALVDMRNKGFLRRECSPSFLHELLHERFDFLL